MIIIRIHFHLNFYILLFLDCRSTLSTTPIADIKTSKLVEPADINGSGKPVGGIEPLNISYCIIKLTHIFYCFSTSTSITILGLLYLDIFSSFALTLPIIEKNFLASSSVKNLLL